ncbi:uncharacterized protein SPSC_01684 [Sporisorium scitamineum]|uniref:Las1-domain-containing protein n=1 Tax=Sporisorium scitamineum TaxID=49012 RepID=A0A0F7RTF1_9BASI|nr:hypothetical protein [Sporisorium scitamineum]CDU23054.1 uncharacterized protein SPSC_01684 [Sporisorium scitamineum]
MKPPKRSPFLHSRQADLLEVYRNLFPDPQRQFNAVDRHHALSTVQLWINRSACPFAVETTALLVQSAILDETMQQIAASTVGNHSASTSSPRYALEQMGGGAELGVRLNYSLALTRFVNSVVDSYQTGGFAQSIAAIAARIGLPLWFVEVRHAATHEELPSIAVCRQAAGSALAWLHRHFWFPQLFPGPGALSVGPAPNTRSQNDAEAMDVDHVDRPESSAAAQAIGGASTSNIAAQVEAKQQQESRKKERRKALQDLRLTLKSYRQLAKQVARDRSLVNKSKDDFRRLYKQVAGFVLRIRTLEPDYAAQLIDSASSRKKGKNEEMDVKGAAVMDPDEVDECTKSAMSDLVNQLIQPGGLIPLGKSKRVSASATDQDIALPSQLASLWTPLLGYLRDTFGPIFGQLLAEELVDAVVRDTAADTSADSTDENDDDSDPNSQLWKVAAFASPGYRTTADAWIRYLVTTAPPSAGMGNASTRAPTTLITDTEVAEMCLPFRSTGSVSMLEFLCERNLELRERMGPLVAVLKVSSFVAAQGGLDEFEGAQRQEVGEEEEDKSGFESQLEAMQKRLREMEAVALATQNGDEQGQDNGEEEGVEEVAATVADVDIAEETVGADANMPTGWYMASADWKPTPFGCLDGKIPNLVV